MSGEREGEKKIWGQMGNREGDESQHPGFRFRPFSIALKFPAFLSLDRWRHVPGGTKTYAFCASSGSSAHCSAPVHHSLAEEPGRSLRKTKFSKVPIEGERTTSSHAFHSPVAVLVWVMSPHH